MNISKVQGIVEGMRNGSDARIRVVSFKRGGTYITQSSEIKSQFSPNGYVFAPNFFDNFSHDNFSAIDFSAEELTFVGVENGDNFRLDWKKDCWLIPSRLYQAPEHFLFSEYAINQPVLKQFISDTNTNIYFQSGERVFGPFKNANGELVPKTGTEVDVYRASDVFSFPTAGSVYVGFITDPPIGKCDCMTLPQLAEWLRGHLKSTLSSVNLNALRRVIESVQGDEINAARAKRSLKILDQLSLTVDELKLLAGSATLYGDRFEAALARVEQEIVATMVKPYEEQIASFKEEIRQLDKQKQLLLVEMGTASHKLSDITSRYDYLVDQKQRLIEDLRVQAEVNTRSGIATPLLTFERQDYDCKESGSCTLSAFGEALSTTMYWPDVGGLLIGRRIVDQLRTRQAILADRVEIIQCLARITGNTTLFIQQVEADWLKFDCFYRNGLSAILNAAHAEPARIFFMLLQDINLANIECYARPVKDLLSGVRQSFPGSAIPWPANLWLFGVPVDSDESPGLGLPLNSGWFRNWGNLPKKLSIKQPVSFEIFGRLSMETILSDPDYPLVLPNDFFDA